MADSPNNQQRPLPLAEAEGSVNERRAKLAAALAAMECDHLYAAFCFMIFDLTAGGVRELQLTREELAWRPNRLCSLSTVRAALGRNRQFQLVAVRPSARDGLRGANLYGIDWSMVDHWIARPSAPSVVSRSTSVATRPTSVVSRSTSVALEGVGGGGGSSCLDINQENTPPPPSVGEFQPTSVATRPTDWVEAERQLRLTGMRATSAAAAEARQRGLSAEDLVAVVDHYLANAASWDGPGAIFHAIRAWLPGDDAAKPELWPTPRKSNAGRWGV